MLQLHPGGTSQLLTLGQDVEKDEHLQVVVSRGTWLGAFLNEGGSFALMGTTMAPGFDFSDYEHGDPEKLVLEYPDRKELITRLTRVDDILQKR